MKSSTKIGSWEVHTKSIGSKIMKKFGWTEGQPLGKNCNGLIEPLNCETFGKFDEKLVKLIKTEKEIMDEKRIWLISQLNKLALDSDDDEKEEKEVRKGNEASTFKRPLRPAYVGEFGGPICWI